MKNLTAYFLDLYKKHNPKGFNNGFDLDDYEYFCNNFKFSTEKGGVE